MIWRRVRAAAASPLLLGLASAAAKFAGGSQFGYEKERRVIREDRPPQRPTAGCRSPATAKQRRDHRGGDRMEGRRLRRMAGLLAARLPELHLDAVARPACPGGPLGDRADPEGDAGRAHGRLQEPVGDGGAHGAASRRRCAGCFGFRGDSPTRPCATRCASSGLLEGLRASLHRAVRAAWRRKALDPVDLPIGVVGAGRQGDGGTEHQRRVRPDTASQRKGMPYGLIRTVTCALVSAAGRPCIDAIPIPAATNEMGHFQVAFASLVSTYGQVVRDGDLRCRRALRSQRQSRGRCQEGLPVRAQERAPDHAQAGERAARRARGGGAHRGRARQPDHRHPDPEAIGCRSELVLRRLQGKAGCSRGP